VACVHPLPENYTIGVHVVGRNAVSYGWVGTYPARGSYASTLWQPDTWFLETYWVPVAARSTLPVQGRFGVAVFLDVPDTPHLTAYDPQGNPLGGKVFFGRIRLDPDPQRAVAPPPPACPTDVRMGDFVTLVGATLPEWVQPGHDLPVVLVWQASGSPSTDDTVFLHLLDEGGNRVAGADAPPQGGDFPTGLWAAGDMIADAHRLPLPESLSPGQYTLLAGMYNPVTNERRPAVEEDGTRLADDAVPLAFLRVGPDARVRIECAR